MPRVIAAPIVNDGAASTRSRRYSGESTTPRPFAVFGLDDRHALHRRRAARQEVHDDEDRHDDEAELRHGGRDRGNQDAESRDRKEVEHGRSHEEHDRARHRSVEEPLDHDEERQSRREVLVSAKFAGRVAQALCKPTAYGNR
jgi:hypothetical protein